MQQVWPRSKVCYGGPFTGIRKEKNKELASEDRAQNGAGAGTLGGYCSYFGRLLRQFLAKFDSQNGDECGREGDNVMM